MDSIKFSYLIYSLEGRSINDIRDKFDELLFVYLQNTNMNTIQQQEAE